MKSLFDKAKYLLSIIKTLSAINVLSIYTILYSTLFFRYKTGIGQYWDWSFPYFRDQITNYFHRASEAWIPADFGSSLSYSSDYIFRFIVSQIRFLEPEILIYIILLIFFTLGSFGAYLSIRKLNGHWAFLLGIVAWINPIIFYKLTAGHLNYLLSYLVFIYLLYYLIARFDGSRRSYIILGVFVALIGAQIQFFVFAGLFILVYLLLHREKLNRNIAFLVAIPLLTNLFWLLNFYLSLSITDVSNIAEKQSFIGLSVLHLINVFNFTFSQGTLIAKNYSLLFQLYFIPFYGLILYSLIKKSLPDRREFLVSSTFVIFLFLSTGVLNYIDFGPVSVLAPMLREVGHYAGVILYLGLIILSRMSTQNRKVITGTNIYLSVFILINIFMYATALPSVDYSYARKVFSPFLQFENQNLGSNRSLSYPFFGQYELLDRPSRIYTDGKFRLSNTGSDNFLKYASGSHVNGSVASFLALNSLQYKLTTTMDVSILEPYAVRYIYDFSQIYESHYEKYVPEQVYGKNISNVKNDPLFFEKLLKANPNKLVRISPSIYEVTSAHPYITTFTNLITTDASTSLEILKNSATSFNEPIYFHRSDRAYIEGIPSHMVIDLFDDRTSNQESEVFISEGRQAALLIDASDQNRYLKLEGNVLTVSLYDTGGVKVNDRVYQSPTRNIESVQIDSEKQYYVSEGEGVMKVVPEQAMRLFAGSSTRQSVIYESGTNLVPNGSFEEGLWREAVSDCNAFDDNAIISMTKDDSSSSHGDSSLRFDAQNHIACTFLSFNVTPGTYVLAMDVQSANAKFAGFNIGFDDPEKKNSSVRIQIPDTDWRNHSQFIQVPEGTTKALIYIYGYSLDGEKNITTNYDNVSFRQLSEVATLSEVEMESNENVVRTDLDVSYGTSTFSYSDSAFTGDNVIPNGSFESGLWQSVVNDCYNYDDNPIIGMSIHESEDIKYSKTLQLEANRHVACTSTTFPIRPGSYEFTFDYQSPNMGTARYFIDFGDKSYGEIKGDVSIQDDDWKQFTKKITVPVGVDSATVYLYASQNARKETVINRYDNVSLVEVPEIDGEYILSVYTPELSRLSVPKKTSFFSKNSVWKEVTVSSSQGPFFLSMSENYHKKWRLALLNKKINGSMSRWLPLTSPDTVREGYHLKANDFQNVWYIDPIELCGTKENLKDGCAINSDGSYDMELVLEFTPQRWFYLGLLISGTTLASCLGYLVYDSVRRRRLKNVRHTLDLKNKV